MANLRKLLVVSALLAGLVVYTCRAESTNESLDSPSQTPFAEAVFTYSGDPTKALLSVSSRGMAGHERTIQLFGDGRLVFAKVYGGETAEEETSYLEHDEIEQLLRLAVDYGLAEWHISNIHEKMRENNNGRLYTVIPSDATRDWIQISLETYQRGNVSVRALEKEIDFQGAAFVERRLPPILEIEGIIRLKRALYEHRPTSRSQP